MRIQRLLSLPIAALMLFGAVSSAFAYPALPKEKVLEPDREEYRGQLIETDLPSGIYDDGHTLILHPDDGSLMMSYDPETQLCETFYENDYRGEGTRSPDGGFAGPVVGRLDTLMMGAPKNSIKSNGYLDDFGPIELGSIPIANAYDLYNIRNVGSDKSFYLLRDIDVAELARYGIEWEPIPGCKTFDGRGHTVRSLTDSLFVSANKVKNVTVVINAVNCCGGIARIIDGPDTVIDNCIVRGSISGNENGVCGGIVGYAYANGPRWQVLTSNPVISNCINYASISSSGYSGGIVGYTYYTGYNYDYVDVNTRIVSCVNKGTVRSQRIAGGIVGYFNDCDIINCTNEGGISCPSSLEDVPGALNDDLAAAGISGRTGVKHISIQRCTNTGSITGFNSYGICAYYVTAAGCKNEGQITGTYIACGIGCGGFTHCVNSGSVTGGYAAFGIGRYGYDDACASCINLGTVKAESDKYSATAAGIGEFGNIGFCCSMGRVSAYSSAGSALAGGIASKSWYSTKCCNVICDSITAETTYSEGKAYAGGIIAYLEHQGGAPHYFGCFKCDTDNISAAAPQAKYAYKGAFIGYYNSNYGNGISYLATNTCLTTSGLPFSGRSADNPAAYDIRHIDSLTECRRQVIVKVINKNGGNPIKNAVVNCDGVKALTNEDGIARINVFNNHALLLAVSKDMFECVKVTDPELNVMHVVEICYDGISDGQQHDSVTLPSGDEISLRPVISGLEELEGPSLSFRGKNSPAYKVELGVELPMGTMYSLYDSKTDTLKVLFGVKINATYNTQGFSDVFNEDFNDVFDSIYNLAHNVPKDANSGPGKFGLECEGRLVGFMLLSLSDRTGLELIEGGVQMSFDLKVPGYKMPFWGIFYAQIVVAGSFESTLKLKLAEGNIVDCTGNIGLGAQLTGKLGTNIIELAKAEFGMSVSMDVSIDFPFESLVDSVEVEAALKAFVEARFLLFYGHKTWDLAKAQLWPLPYKDGEPAIDMDSVLSNEAMKPEPRDYLIKSGIRSGGAESLVLQGVYPDGEPRIAQLSDGRLVLVWAHDDGTRTDMNRTAIYYTVFDNGAWSAPAMLWDDGTADFSPVIAACGNDLHIVWQNLTEVLADDAELEYALEKTALCHTVLHSDGTIDTPEVICPEGKYQSKISIAAENGKVCAAWLQNSENDVWCDSGTVQLLYTEFADGEWSEPSVAAAGVVDAVCGYSNGERVIAYIFNSKPSAQDAKYYDIYRYTPSGTQLLAGNTAEDSHPQIVNGEIYWMQDGVLRNTARSLGLEWDGEVLLAASPDGGLTAFMESAGEDFNTDIVTAVYDAQANEWTPAVPLTDYGGAVTWLCPTVLSDGSIAAALTEAPLTGDEDIFGNASIHVLVGASFTDIVLLDGLGYDVDTAAPGGDITLSGTVYNNSMGAVEGLVVNVYDENDALVSTQTLNGTFASGESREISFDCTLPDPLGFAALRAEILPAGLTDDKPENNSAEFTVGMSDLVLSEALLNEEPTGAEVTAMVSNAGFDTAEGVTARLSIGGAEGEVLGAVSLGDMAPGAARGLSFEIPAEYLANESEFDYNYFTVTVTTQSPQAHYYNDQAIVHDYAIRAEGVEITSQPGQMFVFDTLTLSADVLPAEAANRRVTWLSSDTAVLTVDENGAVTAVGSGTATVTAVSCDGGYADSIELTAVYRQYTAVFTDDEGNIISSQTVNEGEAAEAPEPPLKEGYTFVGWSADFNELHEDIIAAPVYEINVYSVFYYLMGELVIVEEYEYGAPITPASAPLTPAYCTFISWGELPQTMPAGSVIVDAEVLLEAYTVTFVDPDGNIIDEQTVEHGSAAAEPQPPDIPGCVFIGWDGDFGCITCDTVITAVYEPAPSCLPGDIDGDGQISFLDVSTLSLFLSGEGVIAPEYLANADVNADGELTYVDLTSLYLVLIG